MITQQTGKLIPSCLSSNVRHTTLISQGKPYMLIWASFQSEPKRNGRLMSAICNEARSKLQTAHDF